MSDIMRQVLQDPPGTWHTPADVQASPTLLARLSAVVRKPHEPVTIVTAVTPTGVDDTTGTVEVESWVVPVISGSVTWDSDRYPGGSATLEVSGNLNDWKPGPAPQGVTHVQPATPTPSPDQGVPWVVTPYGTWVSVFVGWRSPTGAVEGVRVFDGPVRNSRLVRPGRTWSLSCTDATGMVDRVSVPYGLSLRQFIVNSGGPQQTDPSGDYHIGSATKTMLRETAEFYWPVPNRQLAWDEVGYFQYDRLTDKEPVDGMWDIGGKSCWALIEEWHDMHGLEVYAPPGERALIVSAEPATVDETTPVADLTTLDPGNGGVVLGFTAEYATGVNRIKYSFEQSRNAGDEDADRAHRIATVTFADGKKIAVWRSLSPGNLAAVWLDAVEDADDTMIHKVTTWDIDYGDGNNQTGFGPKMRAQHRYQGFWPTRYSPKITFRPENQVVNLSSAYFLFMSLTLNEWYTGLWNLFRLGAPTSVRRSGRETFHAMRTVGERWEWSQQGEFPQYTAARAAERMARRNVGYGRTNTVDIVPMPWVMPRQTVMVQLTDGVKPERHLVNSVTIPLEVGAPMQVSTVKPDLSGGGQVQRSTPLPAHTAAYFAGDQLTTTQVHPALRIMSATTSGMHVDLTVEHRDVDHFKIDWGERGGGTVDQSSQTPAPGQMLTSTAAHTYKTPGTYTITVTSVPAGQTDTKQVTVAPPLPSMFDLPGGQTMLGHAMAHTGDINTVIELKAGQQYRWPGATTGGLQHVEIAVTGLLPTNLEGHTTDTGQTYALRVGHAWWADHDSVYTAPTTVGDHYHLRLLTGSPYPFIASVHVVP